MDSNICSDVQEAESLQKSNTLEKSGMTEWKSYLEYHVNDLEQWQVWIKPTQRVSTGENLRQPQWVTLAAMKHSDLIQRTITADSGATGTCTQSGLKRQHSINEIPEEVGPSISLRFGHQALGLIMQTSIIAVGGTNWLLCSVHLLTPLVQRKLVSHTGLCCITQQGVIFMRYILIKHEENELLHSLNALCLTKNWLLRTGTS